MSDINKTVIEEIHINNKKLESCNFHEFELDKKKTERIQFRSYVCKNCGGTADAISVKWYLTGMKHAAQLNKRLKKALNLSKAQCSALDKLLKNV